MLDDPAHDTQIERRRLECELLAAAEYGMIDRGILRYGPIEIGSHHKAFLPSDTLRAGTAARSKIEDALRRLRERPIADIKRVLGSWRRVEAPVHGIAEAHISLIILVSL
jgi:hypothetical protein